MFSYNIWRWIKLVAGKQKVACTPDDDGTDIEDKIRQTSVVTNTIRIARLKMLFIAAKITFHKRVTTVKYSEHDARASELIDFMAYIDSRRNEDRPWSIATGVPAMT